MNKLLIVDTDVEQYVAAINRQNLADLTLYPAATPQDGQRHIPMVNMILGRPDFVAEVLTDAEKLVWVQSTYAGVEALCAPGLRKDYRLTGIKNVFGPLVSEYVIAYILAMERHLFETRDRQKQKTWRKIAYRSIDGLTIGIAGLGSIGQHLARTAAHFGMRVLGLKHQAGKVNHVETVFTPAELDRFLPLLDYLVLALPNTPATHHLINAEALGKMKSSAVLINVGRGATLDQDAMAVALRAGTIKGAVLDVFESEPLPASSSLWDTPNTLITPHNAAYSFPTQIAAIFCDNYRRFVEGKSLKYIIDIQRGY